VVAWASIIEANNNLPSWDSLAGCAAAVHGVNSVGLQAMVCPEGKSTGRIHEIFQATNSRKLETHGLILRYLE